ncbi:hypothetical protein SPACI_050760 [Sporomusa acidovorans DSM 3132]|uniref:Transposase n=1 Tax=Sporomusa acidovorans (strain ATCC 49682 / DSM 3132 / Mol) TaxID=1123286 RepID=A0ABZ3JA92_SPOA4|nr:hypothetical protein SPACI_10240 [Sporomusa acidovorans DSM 3132]SDE94124.1 hypothetical protein SAMN04488499_102729 [Sporomusa acidovorans]
MGRSHTPGTEETIKTKLALLEFERELNEEKADS